MNIKNLEVGMIAKNYKDLCRILETEPRKNGNSKNAHLAELKRYFRFEKADRGNSLEIIEVYDKSLDKEDKRAEGNNTNPFTKDGELLMIDLLLSSKGYEITLPTNSLLLALNMVNKNYRKYFGDLRPLLSKGLDIEIEFINDYFESVNSSLYGSVKTIIGRLKRKKLVRHREVTMVKEMELDVEYTRDGKVKLERKTVYGENGETKQEYTAPKMKVKETYREATPYEDSLILKIEREELVKLGFNENDTENLLYNNGSIHKYYKNVNNRLFDELNFSRVYTAHKLIFNSEYLEDERIRLLNEIERQLIKDGVNKDVIINIMTNARNRANTAINTIEEQVGFGDVSGKVSKKTVRQADEKYIEYFEILNHLLINSSTTKTDEKRIMKNENKDVEIELPDNM